MSDTPRTDKVIDRISQFYNVPDLEDLCRELERENARLRDACWQALWHIGSNGHMYDIPEERKWKTTESEAADMLAAILTVR